MSFFRSNIDPFCSFAIDLGPLYVERVFDSLLTLQGVKNVVQMGPAERFDRYLDYLRKKTVLSTRDQYSFIQFYKGHFYQQLAGHLVGPDYRRHISEKALCAYQAYLELSGRFDESRYYAQWQTGVLQDLLNYPWPEVERSLIYATAIDPLRGEATKRLIDHCIRQKQWKTAYGLSSAAMNHFFDKNPAAKRAWFVDFNAYNWNVPNKHLTICYKLQYLHEAQETYSRMQAYETAHPEEFTDSDIRHIHFLKKILHSSKPLLASAS
jgi:hypothetical protein